MIKNYLFHRVSPVRDELWDPMAVHRFDRCIRFISNKYDVVTIEELVSSGEVKHHDRLATITFDDGYKDNIEYAAEILKKYRCPASFYVVTDCIDHNTLTWTHILEYSFQFTNICTVDFNFPFLDPAFSIAKLSTKEDRIAYAKRLIPAIKKITHEQRLNVLHTVTSVFDDVELPGLMMDWNDLKVLRGEGHFIGSHTVTHPMLGTMSNVEQIKFELSQSAKRIEQELGYFPTTISYPVGSYNETTQRLSLEMGYKLGLAVKQKVYDPAKDDQFAIPRIDVYNEPWWKMKLRLNGAIENVKSIIGYK